MSQRDSAALRSLLQRFVRDFGLLSSDQTPCGKPLPVSHAHALMVLLECARRGEEPRQSELARELGLDKSSVARLCQQLELSGHVVRAREREDGRVRRLSLSPRGLTLAREVERASQQRFADLYDRIPAARRSGVLEALEVLQRSLAELGRAKSARDSR